QITDLIDYYINKKDYQKALYISLSYDSAARRGEIAQVEKHSFMNRENSNTNIVTGKGDKTFILFYMDRTKDIAEKYLEQRGEDSIDSLWITGKGENKRPIKYSSLYDWVVSFRKVLNKEYKEVIDLNSYSLRHRTLKDYNTSTTNT